MPATTTKHTINQQEVEMDNDALIEDLARVLRWFRAEDASSYEVAQEIRALIAKMIQEAKEQK